MSPRIFLGCSAVLVFAAFAACSSTNPAGVSGGTGGHAGGTLTGTAGAAAIPVTSLSIAPIDSVVSGTYGTPYTVAYQATATPAAGGPPIAVDAVFSLDAPSIGTFSGATLSGDGKHGGKGTVTATYDGLTATTSLTVKLTDDVAQGGPPAGMIPGVVGAMDDPTLAPTWVYPEDGVVIPPNLYGVAFQWTPAAGTDTFVLQLAGAAGQVRVITSQSTVTLDPATWDVAASLCGPGPVIATVWGMASADPSHAGKAARGYAISEKALAGAMYYWSSKGDYAPVMPGEDQTSPRGYFRFDFTNAAPGTPADLFLGFNRAGNNCVGCHSIARDGTLFATSFETDTHWALLDVTSSANPVTWTQGGPSDAAALGNFNAFTPDKRFLLVSGDTTLRAYDLSTSTATLAASFTTPLPASHIAVSPVDTTTVLYVEDLTSSGGTRVGKGRIVRVHWDPSAKSFSNRTVLLEDPTASVYYPAVSPDGAWVIYNRATTGTSLSNPAAEVWATKLDGTGTPVPLARANQAPSESNSWPRWAPFVADDGQGHARYFFTFSSVRPYQATTGVPQLWLSTFDPASTSGDPSTPALWLPVQSLTLHNHAAQWTEVFIPQTQ